MLILAAYASSEPPGFHSAPNQGVSDSPPPHAQIEANPASASPDLLRAMVRTFADALMPVEADAVWNAEYGQVSGAALVLAHPRVGSVDKCLDIGRGDRGRSAG